MTRRRIARWTAAAFLFIAAGFLVGTTITRLLDLPPSDGESLANIVQSVEQKELGAIQSLEYEREWWQPSGSWEVVACHDQCTKLYIDAKTGHETRREFKDAKDDLAPANSKDPVAIAKSFEIAKGVITEIEFERGAWHVKYREQGGLFGALQPTKRRAFEPSRAAPTQERVAPPMTPPEEEPPGPILYRI
jgi:hypothetical protein